MLAIAFFLLSLVVSGPVFATDDSNLSVSPSPFFRINQKPYFAEKVQEKLDQKKSEIREKAATRAAEFWEKRKGIVRDRLIKVLTHLDKVVLRLDAVAEKIQSRINRLKEKGIDVTKMQAGLDGCGTTKSAFVAAVSDAHGKVGAITDNGEADGSARAALASVKTAFESGKAHHKCLVGVIVILRAAKPVETAENEN